MIVPWRDQLWADWSRRCDNKLWLWRSSTWVWWEATTKVGAFEGSPFCFEIVWGCFGVGGHNSWSPIPWPFSGGKAKVLPSPLLFQIAILTWVKIFDSFETMLKGTTEKVLNLTGKRWLDAISQAHVYQSSTACAAFLANWDDTEASTVKFQGQSYELPPWSVSILPDCKSVVFNTAKVC